MNLIMKIAIALALFLSSFFAEAQSKSDKIHDQFSKQEGATSISFSKSILEPLEIFIDDDTKKVIYKMKNIKFLNYNENNGSLRADQVYKSIINDLSTDNYFLLKPSDLSLKDCEIHWDKENNIKLIGRGNSSLMDEFHVVINDNASCTLISFYGPITIDDLNGCSRFTCTTKSMLKQ